jgi:hypothetical protein
VKLGRRRGASAMAGVTSAASLSWYVREPLTPGRSMRSGGQNGKAGPVDGHQEVGKGPPTSLVPERVAVAEEAQADTGAVGRFPRVGDLARVGVIGVEPREGDADANGRARLRQRSARRQEDRQAPQGDVNEFGRDGNLQTGSG